MFNVSVEGEHEYFANGILVSNCDCLRYAAMSEPKYVPRKSKRSRDTAAYDEFQEIFGRRRRGMNVGPMA